MSLSQNPSPPRPAPIARGRAAIGRRTRLASVRCSLSKASAPATSTGVWDSDLLRWSPKTPPPRATAPPGLPPIVVLPGFGNNSGDYIAPFGDADGSLSSQLSSRGWRVYVVPLERGDWFNVARSLLTLRFWSSTLTTHPGYTW